MIDLYSKINKGLYTPTLKKPEKPWRLSCPECSTAYLVNANPKACVSCGSELLAHTASSLAAYAELLEAFSKEVHELDSAFKEEAIAYCGLAGKKKADKAYALARQGKNGLMQVLDHLKVLADLVD
jgi:hypothetical protein